MPAMRESTFDALQPRLARKEQSGRVLTRFNDQLAWMLLAVLFLAPVPFGSNRPFFWCLWATGLGAVLLWYCLAVFRLRSSFRIPLSALRIATWLFALVGAVTLIQTLPVGRVFGDFAFLTRSGDVIYSASISLTPGDSWLSFLRWFSVGALFFLMLQVSVQNGRAQRLAKAIVAITSLHALYGLVALTQLGDTILFFEKQYYPGVLTGTFINRNSIATFLGIGAVMASALLFAGRAGSDNEPDQQPQGSSVHGEKLWLAIALVLLLSAVLATQSRMGLAATFAGIGTVLLLSWRASPLARMSALLAVPVLGGLLLLYGSGVAERYLLVERAADTRGALYLQIIDMVTARPLLGYGAGSFEYAYPLFHQQPVSVDRVWEYAHSTYLGLWSDLGVVVGSIPVLIVTLILVAILRKRTNSGPMRPETCAALGATVTVAIHSLVDFSLEIQAVAFLYTALLALGSAKAFYRDVRGK